MCKETSIILGYRWKNIADLDSITCMPCGYSISESGFGIHGVSRRANVNITNAACSLGTVENI